MTKLEEIARAIWAVNHPDAPWDSGAGPGVFERHKAFSDARAAVKAMREPSEAMLYPWRPTEWVDTDDRPMMAANWKDMIDAILNEKQAPQSSEGTEGR